MLPPGRAEETSLCAIELKSDLQVRLTISGMSANF